jgi:hypothetical protein
MITMSLIDIRPDPSGLGIALSVIVFVIGLVVLLVGAFGFFLWYRKRSLRTLELAHPESFVSMPGERIQPSNPNHP